MINRIYNSHFTGSSLWDLFNKETRKVENSWSVSFRKIYNLPRNTHRYLVEPISEIPHAKTTLIKNFLGLIDQIQKTHKTVARNLLETIKLDVRSTTGSNLREIMHLLNKDSINDLSKSDVNTLVFSPVPKNEEWRIGFLKELLDIRSNDIVLDSFSKDEIDDMIQFVCTT